MDEKAFFARLFPKKERRLHWTARRKAALVAAIEAGATTRHQARVRFQLSDEELESWISTIARNGVHGLRATRFQIYQGRGKWRAHVSLQERPSSNSATEARRSD